MTSTTRKTRISFLETFVSTSKSICLIVGKSAVTGSNLRFLFLFIFSRGERKKNNQDKEEGERKGGGGWKDRYKVPYPLVGGLRFEATTSFPFVPRTTSPSLAPLPARRANEHRHKGVECTCGWPLVIFIGRVYRRAYRGEKKGRGKREKKREKEGREKRPSWREKTLGRLIFFPLPWFHGGWANLAPQPGTGNTTFFLLFLPLFFFLLFLSDNRHVTRFDLCYLSSTCSSPTWIYGFTCSHLTRLQNLLFL